MGFPERRLRRTPALRRLVAETRLSVDDLVLPAFVRDENPIKVPGATPPNDPTPALSLDLS